MFSSVSFSVPPWFFVRMSRKSEIRNSKFEIAGATGHRMNPHSPQFSRLLGVMSEQLKNSLSLFFTSSILLGVRNPVRVLSCVEIDKL